MPAVHTLGAPLADGPGGRRLALQRRQVHRPLPRNPRDLVLRLGLRRQRPAGQEVLRPAHRLGDGPRRGLAGRAHADPQADLAGRRRAATSPPPSPAPAARPTWPCCSRPCPAGRPRPSATTSAGCASATTAASTPSTRKPASSASRRAPACETNQQRGRRAACQQRLHQRGPDRRRRRLVGRPDRRRRPTDLTDWKGRAWTPDIGEPAAHPNARFAVPAGQCPVIARRVGRPGRRADLGHPVRRPPRHGRAAGHRGLRLGARRVPGLERRLGRHRGGREQASASCAATRSRCCPSAATTWATTSATG